MSKFMITLIVSLPLVGAGVFHGDIHDMNW